MIEYFGFILQCTTAVILWAKAHYIYSLIKMANQIINDLLLEVSHDPPKSDMERHKLIKCILTGNSKQIWEKLILKNG